MMMEIGPDDYATCVGCGEQINDSSEGRLLMSGPTGHFFIAMCNKCIERSAQRDACAWFNRFFESKSKEAKEWE